MDLSDLRIRTRSGETLIQQIRSGLRRHIESGRLQHGQRLPSLRQLSRETGVSIGVVRQAVAELSNSGHLRVDDRRGIFVSRPPVQVADIALVLPALASSNLVKLMDGIIQGLQGTQYRLVVESAQGNYRKEMALLERLDKAFLAGVLIQPPPFEQEAEVIRRMIDRGLPCVQVVAAVDQQNLPSVTVDSFEMGRQAVNLLLEAGHRRLGILDTNANAASSRLLRAGFQTALTAAGLTMDDVAVEIGDAEFLDTANPTGASRDSAHRLLEQHPDTTGIIGVSHNRTLGAYRAATDRGMSIPDDLSLVAIGGNDDVLSVIHPGIASIAHPLSALGQRAALMLQQLIDGCHPTPSAIQLSPEIHSRKSVSAPRRSTPAAGQAC